MHDWQLLVLVGRCVRNKPIHMPDSHVTAPGLRKCVEGRTRRAAPAGGDTSSRMRAMPGVISGSAKDAVKSSPSGGPPLKGPPPWRGPVERSPSGTKLVSQLPCTPQPRLEGTAEEQLQ